MYKIISLCFLMLLASAIQVSAQSDTINKPNIEEVELSPTKGKETVKLPYTTIKNERLVGAVDFISGDEIRRSTEYRTNAALAGLAAGLLVNKSAGQPGANGASLKVRGRSRGGDADAPMVVVDGVPHRSLYDVTLESIESIYVLKDITAKMLYGPSAANGVIMLTTKRGKNATRKLSFSVEGGLKLPTIDPKYVNSAQYAELYNQARTNDGLEPYYTQEQIDHYRNGTSPRMYPNEDFHDRFLKNSADYQRITAMLEGGDDKTQYFVNFGFTHEDGLENVGDDNSYNQLDLASNIDYRVNDVIKLNLDLGTKMGLRKRSNVTANDFISALSTHRPNDYPVFVSSMGENPDSLGWSPVADRTNLYGDLTKTGYVNDESFVAKTSLGMDLDFNKYVKGLTARADIGFDTYNTISIGKNLEYASYKVAREDSLVRVGNDVAKGNEQKLADDFTRLVNANAQINYDRVFGKHAVLANAVFNSSHFAYKTLQDGATTTQDDKSVNVGLRLNYAFNNKYVIEGSSSMMGTDRFEHKNRYELFGAVGAGWVISNEDFLKDGLFNHLKLKGSYGVMGYDNSLDYFIYRNEYGGAGSVRFGINNSTTPVAYGQKVSQLGNPNIGLEKSREINLGLEGRLFNNQLSFEVNYFDELRSDIPVESKTQIPYYVSNVFPTLNYNEISNKGVDVAVDYSNSIGDVHFLIGGNFMYSESVHEKYDELNVYEHQNREGKETDAIWGWVYDGSYADEQDIINYGVTSSYGELKPGDIKLMDITNDLGDNVIDTYDKTMIGHSAPRINYALKLNVAYKGFDLYLLGQGVADVDKMLTNSYYYNFAERKYSEQVLRSDYPRLTTYSNNHSYRNSSYWMENGSYFKLRTAQLSYTLPQVVSQKISSSKITFYVKGTDLFSISKIKDLDPEDINAGISKYPLYQTVSLGAKIAF
ncbi:SusC/RagA family TonB-linked outer membrane protein [Labilibacter marinus]|uniref:SusC/RagA family TonB-linked outer membrane protein n=1 Tax=Labilibacter marinus TaxID=1477105 RepID=UPI00094F60FC|nr:SusC/RagA family TonB-linked outer membrane protein [Labilibacter marinus]